MFQLAHLSDLHVTQVRVRGLREVANKRVLAWLSWQLKRRHEHRAPVLDALVRDLSGVAPDHVAVTGDLTNLGLADEFESAAAWLERLGDGDRVTVVPGNHDVTVATPQATTWHDWADYMRSGGGQEPPAATVEFPAIRVRAPLALLGVSSARPTLPLLATGRVGASQLSRLEQALTKLAGSGLARIVLIHHPPVPAGLSRRRQLGDAAALRRVLARAGAELILHGHTHRSGHTTIEGPQGPIPVVGVPSSSALGRRGPERRARYHVYRIEPGTSGAGFRISLEVRCYDPASALFEREREERLA